MFPTPSWLIICLVVVTSCARRSQTYPSAPALKPTQLHDSTFPAAPKIPQVKTATPTGNIEFTPTPGTPTSIAGRILMETTALLGSEGGAEDDDEGSDREREASREDDGDTESDEDDDDDDDDDTAYDEGEDGELRDEDDEYEYDYDGFEDDDDSKHLDDDDDDYDDGESDYDERDDYEESDREDEDEDYNSDDSEEKNKVQTGDETKDGKAEGMVHMFLQGNESKLLSPFYRNEINHSLDALVGSNPPRIDITGDVNNDKEKLDDNELTDIGKDIYIPKVPYVHDDGYIPRPDTVIVLSDEQLRSLVGAAAAADAGNETESVDPTNRYEGETSRGNEATTKGSSTDIFIEDSAWNATLDTSTDFHNKSEYITEEELDEILKIYRDFIVNGKEEWEVEDGGEANRDRVTALDTGSVTVSGIAKESQFIQGNSLNTILQDTEEKQSGDHNGEATMISGATEIRHTTTTFQTKEEPSVSLTPETPLYVDPDVPLSSQNNIANNFSQIYEELIKSNELTADEEENVILLERLRRTVESLGGVESFRSSSQVHRIVKRQLMGNEACGVFSRKRRNVETVIPTSPGLLMKNDEVVRRKRGVSNVGRRLEQGNVGYRQLYNQYKNMCTFIAMTVFEK